MDEKPRCQSCGMPLGPQFFGTEADGAESAEFCRFCYQEGTFTQPNLSVDEMIDASVRHMTASLSMSEDRARELASTVIPKLRRWSAA